MKSTRYAAVALDTTTDAPSTPPRLRLLLLRAALFLLIFLFFAWIALCRWELLLALSDPRFIVFELLSLFDPIIGPSLPPARDPPSIGALADCGGAWSEWHTPAWVCRSFSEKTSHTFTVRDFRRLQGLCRERARMYSCSSGTTRALVAGPFASRPKEWHAISLDYSRLLTSTDRIVQFTSDAIDHESGVPVPYPPLHMHHIHITRGPANHWYETHGDYGYHPIDGYTRVLPEGYCDRSALPWGLLLTQINDVRGDGQDLAMSFDEHAGAAQEEEEEALRNGGPLVQWYLRLVFRLQPDERPCKAVTKLIFWYPVTRFANRDPLARFEVRSEEAVLWWTMTSPVSGLILERPWAHAHRARFAGIVLVEGAYNLKSLGVLGTLHAGDNNRTYSANASLASLRERIVQKATQIDALVCYDEPSVPTVAAINGRHYDRPGKVSCVEGRRLTAGTAYTVFHFVSPVWSAHVKAFPQHMMTFLYLDANSSWSQLADTFPNGYGRYALQSRTTERIKTEGQLNGFKRVIGSNSFVFSRIGRFALWIGLPPWSDVWFGRRSPLE